METNVSFPQPFNKEQPILEELKVSKDREVKDVYVESKELKLDVKEVENNEGKALDSGKKQKTTSRFYA